MAWPRRRLLCLAVVVACLGCRQDEPAELVLVNGAVYAVGEDPQWASAIAVRDGRILAVGPAETIERFVGPQTLRIDLDGRMVAPGFHDSWIDLTRGSLVLSSVDMTATHDAAEASQRLTEAAFDSDKDQWLIGHGWIPDTAESLSFENGHPWNARAVLLLDGGGDTAWLNRAGFERLTRQDVGIDGIDGPGLVTQDRAVAALLARVDEAIPEHRLERLERAADYLHRFGLTSVTDMGSAATVESTRQALAAYRELTRSGRWSLRVQTLRASPSDATNSLVLGAERGSLEPRPTRHWLRLSPGEILDGSQLRRPGPRRRESFEGVSWAAEARSESEAHRALGAFAARTERGSRHLLAGAGLLELTDWPALAAASVIWVASAHDPTPSRLARIAAPPRVIFGSGWPRNPIDPLLGMATAVAGGPGAFGTPMSLEDVLRAYTLGAAYGGFREADLGSLVPGKLADLVVLSEDLFRIPPHRVAEVRADLTLIEGRFVYVAEGVLAPEEIDSLGRAGLMRTEMGHHLNRR